MEKGLIKHSVIEFSSSRSCDFQNLSLTSWAVLGSLTEEEGMGEEVREGRQGAGLPDACNLSQSVDISRSIPTTYDK